MRPFPYGVHLFPTPSLLVAHGALTTVSLPSHVISNDVNRLFTASVGYLSRKALPIKHHDAEPLTRGDVQFDLLNHIFSDRRAVFTNQTPGASPAKITFSELYINALSNSSKCSKVLKDKMIETPAFAIELAKISLLTNVGRINTTMACAFTYSSVTCFPPNQC